MEPTGADPTAVLADCDSEPIHLLGAIQPIGFLLSVDTGWIVARASDNVGAWLGVPHDRIVGQPVAGCLPTDILHDIRGRLQESGGTGIVAPLFGRRLAPDGPLFAVAVHRSGDEIVVEFEQDSGEPCPAPTAMRAIIARVERYRAPAAVFREAARQIRALTGFDRVMVYWFDEGGHGEVVGESVRNGVASFMGLRYPASDIPAQARALYLRNLTRLIADVDATTVAITPARAPDGSALDLSMSVLRSVSPTHLEYLRNMGVRASMSISILQGERLWGLIACHHCTAKHVGLQMRLTAELFGQMFSYLLEVRERLSEAIHDTRSQEIHNRIAAACADPALGLRTVPEFLADVTDYVQSDGIGIYHAGEVELVGLTPTQDEFLQLVRFLTQTPSGRIFATNELSAAFPPGANYVMRAAGILAVPISRTPRDYLVFFRRESVQTVTWAGEPVKPAAPGAGDIRLAPRKSFDAWRQIVQGKCAPWTKRELRAAKSLRLTLLEVALRMSDIAEADDLGGRHRQEMLIAELNHRVRNLLGLVRGLIIQVAATASDVSSMVEGLDGRILSMARAYDLLTLNQWTSGSLHGLIHAEAAVYGELGGRLVLAGPDVVLQPKAFSAMALVVHELTTNARKYGALKTLEGQVTVATGLDAAGDVTMTWRETGGPAVAPPVRRGFGSTILEQAIPFEVNGRLLHRCGPAGGGGGRRTGRCGARADAGRCGGADRRSARRDGQGGTRRPAEHLPRGRGQPVHRDRRRGSVAQTWRGDGAGRALGGGRPRHSGRTPRQLRPAGREPRLGDQPAGRPGAAGQRGADRIQHRLRRGDRLARSDGRRADHRQTLPSGGDRQHIEATGPGPVTAAGNRRFRVRTGG